MHYSSQRNSSATWIYLFLLAIQTVGAAIFYAKGLPLYRQVLTDPSILGNGELSWMWSVVATILMQGGYWIRYHTHMDPPQYFHVVFGHVVLFISRLSFVLATSIFSFLFISKKLEAQISAFRYALLFAGLFSLFCYMQELQNLGNMFLGLYRRPDQSQ
jgi:hypothetical protein